MNQQTLPLEDIILPPAVGFWPLAWGWWLVIVLSAVAVLALSWWLIKRVRLQRKKQRAEKQLNQSTHSLSGTALYMAVNTWLKIQAQAAYPDAQHLHGEAWIEFLHKSAGRSVFTDQQAQALGQGLYQQTSTHCDPDLLIKNARLWLTLSKALKGGRL